MSDFFRFIILLAPKQFDCLKACYLYEMVNYKEIVHLKSYILRSLASTAQTGGFILLLPEIFYLQ